MVNRENGTRANGHRANRNRANVVAPDFSSLNNLLFVHKL